MRKRSKKSFDLVLVIVDGSREGRANAASPPHSVLTWKPYQQHVVHSPWNSFLGRRFSEGVIIIINMMMTTPKHNLSFWGAPKMRYCVLRIQAWPDGCHLCGEKTNTFSTHLCICL